MPRKQQSLQVSTELQQLPELHLLLQSHPDQEQQGGGGISFNGDTATTNALDDYEEGTWTPGVSSSSGTITRTSDSDCIVRCRRVAKTFQKLGACLTHFSIAECFLTLLYMAILCGPTTVCWLL